MKNQKVFLLFCLFFSFTIFLFGQDPGTHPQGGGSDQQQGGELKPQMGGGGVLAPVGGNCGEDGSKNVTYLSIAGETGSALDLSGGSGNGWTNQIRFFGSCKSDLQHVIASHATSGRLVIAPGFEGSGDGVLEVHGKIAIGTQDVSAFEGYKLYVNGGILAKEVRVASGWGDYVFYDDYKLRPLAEVRTFITTNGHLPDIPPAKEIEENGINVADITVKQQVKIEELFLYVLEMEERLIKLELENRDLRRKNNDEVNYFDKGRDKE